VNRPVGCTYPRVAGGVLTPLLQRTAAG